MGSAPVSVSTGAMNSLLKKLTALPEGRVDGKSSKGQRLELSLLRDELTTMNGQLQDLAKQEESTAQQKQWMLQVREMAYDIEDWIDEFVQRASRDADRHAGRLSGVVQRAVNRLASGDKSPVDQIREFKERIKEANERQGRYELKCSTPSGQSNDPTPGVVSGEASTISRQRALRADETIPVGIQNQRDVLVNQLKDQDKKLKVVSLVGVGGLGKTTLAKQVYHKLKEQFKYRAFVYAGRNPSVKMVLKSIIDQVNRHGRDGDEPSAEQALVQRLRILLKGKKYLILVDDVWSSTIWQVIKSALPDDKLGSRIMVTTRIRDVATSSRIHQSDIVHEVEPLGAADSKALFTMRFDPSGNRSAQEMEDVWAKVSKGCGGVPLAIINIAGLLTSKPAKVEQIARTLSTQERLDADGMRKVLYLSYSDLSHHLKSCLLYMSVFPEAYNIRKDQLIRMWIAEGFVCERVGESLQETGEGYLNELIERNLAQQVSIDDDDDHELGYTVHDMVRELIISLSVEENFVTVPVQWINLMPHDKIRRLSLQYSNQEVAPTIPSGTVLSHVRSLTVFGPHEGELSDLIKSTYLRVLDLQHNDKLNNDHVKSMAKLYHLKYLGLDGKGITKIPEQIGELECMETLDVRKTEVRELPASVVKLPKIIHLLVTNAKLPDGIGKLAELQELSMVNVSKSSSPKSVEDLANLKKLRILGVNWCLPDGDHDTKAYGDTLVSVLNDLRKSKLQSLTLDTDNGKSKLDFLLDSWLPPYRLQKFKLRPSDYYFSRFPTQMADLPYLAYLEIGVAQVTKDDVKILGSLPSLIILKLRSSRASTIESFEIRRDEFPLLQEFWFMRHDGGIKGVIFGDGAMTRLRKLRLQCNLQGAISLGDFKFGIKNLNCVKQVYVKIDYKDAEVAEVEAAEDAIRKAADVPSECELDFALRG